MKKLILKVYEEHLGGGEGVLVQVACLATSIAILVMVFYRV